MVAHPDDCIIFARPFMEIYNKFDWRILYLTYCDFEPRGREIANYWRPQGITTIHLGYTDTYKDMENNSLSFNQEQAAREIVNICKDYSLILTHNADGDYGHIHHQFVSQCVTASGKPTVYFAKHEQANMTCTVRTDIDLTALPLHKEVIESFENINQGRYTVADSVMEVIDGTTKTWNQVHL